MELLRRRKKEMENQQALDVLLGLTWSSKASLKKACILAYRGDIGKAKEAYDFLTDGLENLPETDPMQPSTMEQMRDMANGVIGWIGQNQGTLVDTFNTVRGLFSRVGAVAEEAEEVTIEE